MFTPLPVIEPRDTYKLWYTPSNPPRTSGPSRTFAQGGPHQQLPHHHPNAPRRGVPGGPRGLPNGPDSLAALMIEEHTLRLRKQNIASFGFAWIRPAGFPKTMMGLREEELEREENAATAAALSGADFAPEGPETMAEDGNADGTANEAMERDLDGDVPDADEVMGRTGGADGEGSDGEEEADTGALVEAGEGDLEEEDEDAMMGRDLDDDIPDGFGDEYDDDQRDLDDDIPSASEDEDEEEEEEEDYEDKDEEVGDDSFMARNLDSDIPDAADEHGGAVEEQEWEHTDTDADDDDDDDEDEDTNEVEMAIEEPRRRPHPLSRDLFRTDVSALAEPVRLMPQQQPRRETEAERLFLERWGDGGGSADFGTDDMMPEPNLRIPRRRTRRYSAQSDSSNSID